MPERCIAMLKSISGGKQIAGIWNGTGLLRDQFGYSWLQSVLVMYGLQIWLQKQTKDSLWVLHAMITWLYFCQSLWQLRELYFIGSMKRLRCMYIVVLTQAVFALVFSVNSSRS